MNVLSRSIVVLFVGTLLAISCGGDSSGGSTEDSVEVCKQWCNKLQSLCFADAGVPNTCDRQCAPGDGGTGGGTTCTNQSEINSAAKGCLEKNTCNDLLACVQQIPRCQGGGNG